LRERLTKARVLDEQGWIVDPELTVAHPLEELADRSQPGGDRTTAQIPLGTDVDDVVVDVDPRHAVRSEAPPPGPGGEAAQLVAVVDEGRRTSPPGGQVDDPLFDCLVPVRQRLRVVNRVRSGHGISEALGSPGQQSPAFPIRLTGGLAADEVLSGTSSVRCRPVCKPESKASGRCRNCTPL
jgi:hypothetical protein